jgi:hypothetical protein
MNNAQLHLLLNHFPSIAQIAGIGAFVIGTLFKRSIVQQTGAWIIFIAALFVIPVSRTGEEAEEQIEDMVGVDHQLIHEHEEAAETAFVLTLISGAAALGFIIIHKWKNNLTPVAAIAVILAGGASVILLANASHKGGFIRHPEIMTGATNTIQSGSHNKNESNEREHDD